jgi:hypothetical protein
MRLLMPRSRADFDLLCAWTHSGITDDRIVRRIQSEWRSEVIELAGQPLRCALCLRTIQLETCLECGQTIQKES